MNDRFKFRMYDTNVNKMYMPNDFGGVESIYECLKQQINWDLDVDYDIKFNHLEDGRFFMQCTGLRDRNGKLIYEGDIVTYYHNKKKLVPVTDRKPFEAPYGNDEETGLPLQYRTVKVIRYKGYVSIDAIGGMELNLRHNLHWWKSLEKDILTQVEVIGNIYENKELLDSEV